MMIVSKFLMFELETGGQFWGWLGIIVNSILVVLLLLAMLFFSSVTCDDFLKFLHELNAGDEVSLEQCEKYHIGIKAFIILSIILLIVGIIFCILLIVGIKNRNHCQILPAAIAQGIDAILLLILAPFTGSFGAFFWFAVTGVAWFYMFIVLLSLYEKVKLEKKGTYNAQYVHP